jgi:hypothetical protein
MRYSKEGIDIMHIEDAIFQSVNKASKVTSVDVSNGVFVINGKEMEILDEEGEYVVDLSPLPNEGKVSRYMSNIWDGYRIFPNSYADDVPLDEIEPTQVDRYVPTDVEEFYSIYKGWVEECIEQTLEKDSETGFVQDSMDNILGVIVGELGKITWPVSIVERHGVRFHTHPEITFTADPSVADLEILKSTKGEVGADAVASTFGLDEIYTIGYVVKIRDKSVEPEEEVRNYIDEMLTLVEEELAIGKKLVREGKLDLDEKVFGDDIEEMAKSRVDTEEKRKMIREIAADGYRIEASWAVVE